MTIGIGQASQAQEDQKEGLSPFTLCPRDALYWTMLFMLGVTSIKWLEFKDTKFLMLSSTSSMVMLVYTQVVLVDLYRPKIAP